MSFWTSLPSPVQTEMLQGTHLPITTAMHWVTTSSCLDYPCWLWAPQFFFNSCLQHRSQSCRVRIQVRPYPSSALKPPGPHLTSSTSWQPSTTQQPWISSAQAPVPVSFLSSGSTGLMLFIRHTGHAPASGLFASALPVPSTLAAQMSSSPILSLPSQPLWY